MNTYTRGDKTVHEVEPFYPMQHMDRARITRELREVFSPLTEAHGANHPVDVSDLDRPDDPRIYSLDCVILNGEFPDYARKLVSGNGDTDYEFVFRIAGERVRIGLLCGTVKDVCAERLFALCAGYDVPAGMSLYRLELADESDREDYHLYEGSVLLDTIEEAGIDFAELQELVVALPDREVANVIRAAYDVEERESRIVRVFLHWNTHCYVRLPDMCGWEELSFAHQYLTCAAHSPDGISGVDLYFEVAGKYDGSQEFCLGGAPKHICQKVKAYMEACEPHSQLLAIYKHLENGGVVDKAYIRGMLDKAGCSEAEIAKYMAASE